MSALTETVAQRIVNAIDKDPSGSIEVAFAPEDDVRSGGTFFEVTDPRGHLFTVLVTEEPS